MKLNHALIPLWGKEGECFFFPQQHLRLHVQLKKSLTVNVQLFSTMYSYSHQCTTLLTELKLTTPARTGLLQHSFYYYLQFQYCVAAICYSRQHSMHLNPLAATTHSSCTTLYFCTDLMTLASRKLSQIFYLIHKQHSN